MPPSIVSAEDYLKQIGKVALLNAEQEVELAKRIEAGRVGQEKINRRREVRAEDEEGARLDRRGRPAGEEPPPRPTCARRPLAKRYTGRGMLFL